MFSPVKIVRFWLPLLIFVVGAAMLVISPDIVGVEGAALMLGGGLGIVVSNRIHRMGIAGEKDRDEEMGARAFYAKYGVWPDEASEELLDRAELEGDIEPRPPLEEPVGAPGPVPVATTGPVPGSAPAASASADPRVDPHQRAPSPPGASDRHPHASVRRGATRTPRRTPRR